MFGIIGLHANPTAQYLLHPHGIVQLRLIEIGIQLDLGAVAAFPALPHYVILTGAQRREESHGIPMLIQRDRSRALTMTWLDMVGSLRKSRTNKFVTTDAAKSRLSPVPLVLLLRVLFPLWAQWTCSPL